MASERDEQARQMFAGPFETTRPRERIARALFDVWARHDRIWSLAERADAWEKSKDRYVSIWAQADAVLALLAAPAAPAAGAPCAGACARHCPTEGRDGP